MKKRAFGAFLLLAWSAGGGAAPQQNGGPPNPAAFAAERSASEARFAGWKSRLPAGTGPFPVVRVEDPTLPGYTLYLPQRLTPAVGKLPIIAFANGVCRNTSIEFAAFLAEVASHGYLVIAIGTDDVPFDFTMAGGSSPGGKPLASPDSALLTRAIDWP